MKIDVSSIIVEKLSHNRGPDPLNPDNRIVPDYGVTAFLTGDVLAVVLTFRTQNTYCCMESSCHLSLPPNGKRWERLRSDLDILGVIPPPRLKFRLSCVVEEGAMFFDFSQPDFVRPCWYAFKPAIAQEYQLSTLEASNSGNT